MTQVRVTQLHDCYLVQTQTTANVRRSDIVAALVAALSKQVPGEVTVIADNKSCDTYSITAKVS